MQLRQIIFSLHLSAALQFSRHTISSLLYYDNGFHSDAKLFYIKVYFTQQIFLRSQKASHFRGAGLRNTNAFWAGRQKKKRHFQSTSKHTKFSHNSLSSIIDTTTLDRFNHQTFFHTIFSSNHWTCISFSST